MKKIASIILTVVAIALLAPVSAFADNSSVPHTLLDARDHLLKERQQLMIDRADTNTKLNFLSSSRAQIEKALAGASSSPQLNRQALQDARSKLLTQISRMQMYLDHTEKDLMDNDKDLNLVETEMKHFACMSM
jgi:hypothetical protein